jgi:hypothetical protein
LEERPEKVVIVRSAKDAERIEEGKVIRQQNGTGKHQAGAFSAWESISAVHMATFPATLGHLSL